MKMIAGLFLLFTFIVLRVLILDGETSIKEFIKILIFSEILFGLFIFGFYFIGSYLL